MLEENWYIIGPSSCSYVNNYNIYTPFPLRCFSSVNGSMVSVYCEFVCVRVHACTVCVFVCSVCCFYVYLCVCVCVCVI